MVLMIVIYGGLIIWASMQVTGYVYRLNISSESVKVNNGLEVFGEHDFVVGGSDSDVMRQAGGR